ncbi:MAG: hypothetical protein HY097_03505 [Nitrospinae bacterium]|nr:hypothetical protein [Nitrospinota bacterium]
MNKEIIKHLESEGFKEVGLTEKRANWYKKAAEKPECLKEKSGLSYRPVETITTKKD